MYLFFKRTGPPVWHLHHMIFSLQVLLYLLNLYWRRRSYTYVEWRNLTCNLKNKYHKMKLRLLIIFIILNDLLHALWLNSVEKCHTFYKFFLFILLNFWCIMLNFERFIWFYCSHVFSNMSTMEKKIWLLFTLALFTKNRIIYFFLFWFIKQNSINQIVLNPLYHLITNEQLKHTRIKFDII